MTTKARITIAAGILGLATLALILLDFAESDAAGNAGRGAASDLVSTGTAATSEDSSIAGSTDEAHREVVHPIADRPGAGSLTVRAVFETDRSPAAGFTLTVRRSGEDSRVGVRRARTDENGVARVDGLAPGRTSVRADRTSVHKIVVIRVGEDRDVELVVPTGLNITGIVVDESDVPVPGAEVHFAPPMFVGRDMIQIATSGLDGRFTLRACCSPCLLGARAEGYAPSRLAFRRGGKGTTEDVRLVLPAGGGAVEGSVLGPGGTPVADAVVRIGKGRLSVILAGPAGAPAPPAQTTSDAGGRFRAIGVAPGEYPVAVRAPGLAPWAGTCRVVAGETATIRVVLPEGVTVRGTVRDDLGLALERVSVWFGESGAFDCYTVRSAADGSFALYGLPGGEIELAASHRLLGKRSTVLHGVVGGSLRWDFFLQRGIHLSGRVLTDAGDPVRGHVEVRAEPRDGALPWSRGTRTDRQGRFELINCPEGRNLTIVAKGANIETITRSGVDPKAGEVVLRGPAVPIATSKTVITGRVVDPDGDPIVNATVGVRREGENSSPVFLTKADGAFRTRPQQPGTYRVSVSARGYPVFRDGPRKLAADTLLDIGTVRLVKGGTVRIRSIEGGAEDVRLLLHGGDGSWKAYLNPTVLPVRSQPLVPGTYQLQLKGKGIAAQLTDVVVRAGQETIVDLRLHKGIERRIEFATRVAGLAGSTLRVRITSAAGNVFDRQITGRGRDLPKVECSFEPGTYRVTAENDGWIGEAGFTVTNGGTVATIVVAMHKR